MKFNYESEKDAKMSSKKKRPSNKTKTGGDGAAFTESRTAGQNAGKSDGEPLGFPSSSMHDMTPFTDSGRFPDGNWSKDGYGKMPTLQPPPHFNNFNPGFPNMVSYSRQHEDGDPMRMIRNEHYTAYDAGKPGFMNSPGVGRHLSESQMPMLPPRAGFPGGSTPGLSHGFGSNPPQASGFMQHGQTSGMQQQSSYPTPTPVLTQLLRYPNPGEKFPGGMDEYRTSGPPTKSWMENVTPGMNQSVYPPRPSSMPFYEQRPVPQMNQTHSNQITAPPPPPPLHGSQGQHASAAGNPNIFSPPPYIQSCNPSQRVDINDKCPRSSSQPRPMSASGNAAVSSGPSSLGSPNHIRPISPVPTSMPPHSHPPPEKVAGSSMQKLPSSSVSKTKKRKEEINNIQDISSCDEGGSDSSSSTEVYSQITPMSTPSTTPLPPQSSGTKPSPHGSEESPSNTPAPAVSTAPLPSSGATVLPGATPLGSLSSLPGASSLAMASQSESLHSSSQAGLPHSGNYPRSPGGQSAYRTPGHPNHYTNPSQMYGATGPLGMHPGQPCGNYPYPGPNKAGPPGQYIHSHSQAMPPGIHHPMEMENTSATGKGYGMPGGMYVPGKLTAPPSGQAPIGNASIPGLHYHMPGMSQANQSHQGQFGKTGYGGPPQFAASPGNGVGPSHHQQQHMSPYPNQYMGHMPPNQMPYGPRQMLAPHPHGTGSGAGMVEHGAMRPASPAFYRGGHPMSYEGEGPSSGAPAGSAAGRSQWVTNMQGMSGGSLVEASRGENIPSEMPPTTIPSGGGGGTGAGELQRMRNAAFDSQMAKDRSGSSPISSSDCTSAESKSSEMMMMMTMPGLVKQNLDQPKLENDFSNASAADSQGRGMMMSPGVLPPKSLDMDSCKKDIGSDSNSLPGQERSRPDSDKQETLSSPPTTPFNHITSSPASVERDMSSPSMPSAKASSSSSVFNKIADMGSEQDRGIFLERLFSFMSYRGTPITAVPVICKQTVDLYRLYHLVRERGGMVDVTKNKKWREVSTSLNLGASSSAGFTLKRNYAKFLFPFECRYDRGNIDPAPIIASMEMSTKKESKKNIDRQSELDNCRPPSNQSFSGYPGPGQLTPHGMPHGMPAEMPSRGMSTTMVGSSPSNYNGGLAPGAIGRGGMMSPIGMMQNHSSMARSSENLTSSSQDSVSIQDPFLDVPSGPAQPYQPQTMSAQMPVYGPNQGGEHQLPASMVSHGAPYEHRQNIATGGGVPPPSMYNNASNQCMPPAMAETGNQGNGFGDICGRGRMLNETGFGNHAIHGSDYSSGTGGGGGGGSAYGTSLGGQGPILSCQPHGERFSGPQVGYPGSVPMSKHAPPAELNSSTTGDQSYYSPYGNQMPAVPPQRYQSGYEPHFYGGAGQTPVQGYPGAKIAAQGLDGAYQQQHQQSHPIEGPLMGPAMGPPHQTGPYQMQKNQAAVSLGSIPKVDPLYPQTTHDYLTASQVASRSDVPWIHHHHQYGQHYAAQPYPSSHGMHPNTGSTRGPYGLYTRYPLPCPPRYDAEKMQRGPPHHLSPNRDVVFPSGCIEATRPKVTKRRKLTHKDIGSVDAWRLMMALRSGLITESTWALDVLTVLLRDEATSPCLSLSHMPGLLEVLVEHYRHCLILIFGGEFEELEVSSEMQSRYAAIEVDDSDDADSMKTVPDSKMLATAGNYTLKTRDGLSVGMKQDGEEMLLLDKKKWDTFKEFESSAFDWQMGRGDMTLHIIATLAPDGSHNFHRKCYFGKQYEDAKAAMAASSSSAAKEKHTDVLNEECLNASGCSVQKTIDSKETDASQPADVTLSKAECNYFTESTERIGLSTLSVADGDSSIGDDRGKMDSLEMETVASSKPQTNTNMPQSKVTMAFDNFDNNPFTCTQLESLKRSCSELDEETYRPNDGISCRLTDSQIEISQRCLCLSNIFRNLSFIAGNDTEICRHNGLMLILGKLLLLNHQHLSRSAKLPPTSSCSTSPKDSVDCAAASPAESEIDDSADSNTEWWWEMLEGLRENTLVVFANICGQLDLSSFPEEICLPILNGLLHWLVCSSAESLDPLTTSGLSPQRLVLEALCKLCVTDSNIDLVLATPPFSRIVLLITNLASMLSERHQQVVREFAVGLLSCLVPGDTSVARALALQHPSVTLLLEFIEGAEQQGMQMRSTHGMALLRDNPEVMGTSLDMLCRAATILRHLVDVPENIPLISRHQQKLMQLVMSTILDPSVTAILADVLSSCS